MNNKLSNLTVNILTHRTNSKILTDCVKSISKDVAINIIENSENFENKDIFRKFEQNVSIICTGNNLGYAGGHNYGIKNIKTEYILILNPDLVCKKTISSIFKNIFRNKFSYYWFAVRRTQNG